MKAWIIIMNLVLTYLVYTETGFWTALCTLCIMIEAGMVAAKFKKITDILEGLTEISKRDHGLN